MSNEHIAQLVQTRTNLVDDRRNYVAKLAGHGERHDMERWRQILVDLQNTISTIDVAIEDETKLNAEQI